MKAALALLLLAACAEPAATGIPEFQEKQAWAFDVRSDDPWFYGKVSDFAGRLSKATGLDIEIKGWGVPVMLSGDLDIAHADGTLGADGTDECGDTWFNASIPKWTQVDLDPPEGCNTVEFTLLHELIHALGVTGHADYGLMSAFSVVGRPASIDSDALILLCSTLPCTTFQPERWNQ